MIRLSEPTEMDVANAIKRLCAIHRRPYKADMEVMVTEWCDGLKCFSRDVLEAAVNRARDDDEFPTLPKLRKHCFAIERERAPKDNGRPIDPELQCPDCDGRIQWHTVVVTRTEDGIPFSTAKEFVDHRDGCPFRAQQDRMFKLYAYRWPEEGEEVESLSARNSRKAAEHRQRRLVNDSEGNQQEPRRHPASVSAKPIATVADVLPARKPLDPEVERMRSAIPPSTQRIWDDVPLPPEPPEATLAAR